MRWGSGSRTHALCPVVAPVGSPRTVGLPFHGPCVLPVGVDAHKCVLKSTLLVTRKKEGNWERKAGREEENRAEWKVSEPTAQGRVNIISRTLCFAACVIICLVHC